MAGKPHLTIRIGKELREKIHAYAKRHDTNASKLATEYFKRLLEEEESLQEVEQI